MTVKSLANRQQKKKKTNTVFSMKAVMTQKNPDTQYNL